MYPYINDFFREKNIDNYKILMVVGIVFAIACFFILARKMKLDKEIFLFYLAVSVASLVVGLYSAIFFQAIYHYAETGEFILKGMTVMGGILGASIFFVLTILVASLTKIGKKYTPSFWTVVNLLIPCIVIAQCFGRIGCFTAGCCYGQETDSFLGIIFIKGFTNKGREVLHDNPRLPTQLFEAVFMLLLFVAIMLATIKYKKKDIAVLVYAYSYSIFRFFIEFLRDDYRGASLLGLSPSQVQSIVLLLIAITLTLLIYKFKKIPFRKAEEFKETETNGKN